MLFGDRLGWQEVGRGRGGGSFSGRKAEHLPSFLPRGKGQGASPQTLALASSLL